MSLDPSRIDRIIFKRTGYAATFTPKVGDPVSTFVQIADLELIEDYQVEIVDGGARISALRADVGLPKRGDEIIVEGKTWRVEKREYSTDPSLVVLACKDVTP